MSGMKSDIFMFTEASCQSAVISEQVPKQLQINIRPNMTEPLSTDQSLYHIKHNSCLIPGVPLSLKAILLVFDANFKKKLT